jgi:hypothetical protein
MASSPAATVRVLQAVADTDPTPTNLAAVELHRTLAAQGLEMRTLALGPGRRAGLEHDVPTIAPSRRSMATRSAWRNEMRWADVVVLHGVRAMTSATVPPRSSGASLPCVLALWDEQELSGRSGRVERRARSTAAAIVVPDDRVQRAWAGRGDDTPPARVLSRSGERAVAWAQLLRSLTLAVDGPR